MTFDIFIQIFNIICLCIFGSILLFEYMKGEENYFRRYIRVIYAFYSYDKKAFWQVIRIIKVLKDKDLKRLYKGKYYGIY